jgi:hypothetical protein
MVIKAKSVGAQLINLITLCVDDRTHGLEKDLGGPFD